MRTRIENIIIKIFTSETSDKIASFMAWAVFGYFMTHVVIAFLR